MLRKQRVRAHDEIGEFRSEVPLGEMLPDAFPADVVRGRELHIRAAVRYDEAVAVADAGVEGEPLIPQLLLQKRDKLSRLRGGDLARGIVLHGLVLEVLILREGDEVGPEGNVVLLHIYAHGEGFQRGTPRIADLCVIAERAEIGDVAAGLVAVGDGLDQPHLPRLCEKVHSGGVGDFERSASAESGDGIIRHAVSENECIFHNLVFPLRAG